MTWIEPRGGFFGTPLGDAEKSASGYASWREQSEVLPFGSILHYQRRSDVRQALPVTRLTQEFDNRATPERTREPARPSWQDRRQLAVDQPPHQTAAQKPGGPRAVRAARRHGPGASRCTAATGGWRRNRQDHTPSRTRGALRPLRSLQLHLASARPIPEEVSKVHGALVVSGAPSLARQHAKQE